MGEWDHAMKLNKTKLEAFQVDGADFKYLVIYDKSAGCKGRYLTLKIIAGNKTQVIGVELPLADSLANISREEAEWARMDWKKQARSYEKNGFDSKMARIFVGRGDWTSI